MSAVRRAVDGCLERGSGRLDLHLDVHSCFLGVLMAFVIARHRAATGTMDDALVAAAAHTHTLPTSATAGRADATPIGRT